MRNDDIVSAFKIFFANEYVEIAHRAFFVMRIYRASNARIFERDERNPLGIERFGEGIERFEAKTEAIFPIVGNGFPFGRQLPNHFEPCRHDPRTFVFLGKLKKCTFLALPIDLCNFVDIRISSRNEASDDHLLIRRLNEGFKRFHRFSDGQIATALRRSTM